MTDSSVPIDPDFPPSELADQAILFASQHLGPVSESLLRSADIQTRIVARIRAGKSLEDAVLGEIHKFASSNRPAADEFLAFFMSDLLRVSHGLVSPGLRRYMDSGDLVQSILGSIWEDLERVHFESRSSFSSLLFKALRNRSIDHTRRLSAKKRREDLRRDLPPDPVASNRQERSPSSWAAHQEERDRLLVAMVRLHPRDRELLRLHFQGRSIREIADVLDLSEDAARLAIKRATAKLQALL